LRGGKQLSAFFSYILLGLSLAAPIGPVNAAQLEKGIKSGFLHAWIVGLGAVLADGIYMLLVYFGVAALITVPIVKTFLWLFGCFVLVYTGIESILHSREIHINESRKSDSLHKSFLSGFIISITNPLTILFWLGVYGSILAETASSSSSLSLAVYSAAIFIGLLSWDIAMASISSMTRRLLTSHILSRITILSGLSLIGFGLYFGIRGVRLLLGIG
jgi:L-lysine exporter family protein LysE/ArgO